MRARNVLPSACAMTELDARELLSKPLLAVCSKFGPTRVAKTLGCDEKTIRNARDEKSTLRFDTAANLLSIEPTAFDEVLAWHGRRSVPLTATCSTDNDKVKHSTVLKAALALSVALEDDGDITPEEVRANRASIEAARDALDSLLVRLVRAA